MIEEQLQNNTTYIYIVAGIGLVLLVSGKLPILSDNFRNLLMSMRRTAVEKDDADIASLKRQVVNLRRADELRSEQDVKRQEMLEEHAVWDREVYRILQILMSERPDSAEKFDVKFPPPLF